MPIHKHVTLDRVSAAVEDSLTALDNPGFCIRCGAEAEGVEPDARRYECDSCGANGVYGAEELLIMMARPAGQARPSVCHIPSLHHLCVAFLIR
ncbi:MAG TPA: hypothetical protein VKG38_05255 [Solirubrobacteraceae bacterium]|nr:hypothetical protein [Solirubrobacteraceae bacterium]